MDVVLEIKASGLCGSDLKFYRASKGTRFTALGFKGGSNQVIAGHEPCGVVAAVGTGVSSTWRIGDRVIVHHYHGCEVCPHCRTGWTQMCVSGVTGVTGHGTRALHKGAGQHAGASPGRALVFDRCRHLLRDRTPFGALVRMDVTARDTIVVVGQGPVGLSTTQLAAAMGARVIAIDVSLGRTRRAAKFGAAETIDASATDPVDAVRALTSGLGASRTMDTSGTAAGRSTAVRSAAAWGIVGFVGEGDTATIDVSPEMLRKQLTVVGSWTFSTVGQSVCSRFVAEREVPVDCLFTETWSLPQAEEAYRLFDAQASGKAVFLM